MVISKTLLQEYKHFHMNEQFSLNEWFDIWLHEYKWNHVKITTVLSYEDMYNNQIRGRLGDCPIHEIKAYHLQKIYNYLIENSISISYIHCIHAMLHNIFKIAVNNDLIIKNPCDGVTLPSKQKFSKKRQVLSVEEQNIILRFMEQEKWQKYQPVIVTMLGTGVRVGELLALTWEDIDFKTKTISINKSLIYVKNPENGHFEFQYATPKTPNSNRTIPIIKPVSHQLRQHRTFLKGEMRKKTWNPMPGFENLVFPNRYGRPQQRGSIQRLLNRIVKNINKGDFLEQNNLPSHSIPAIHPHTLRHSFATRCFEADIPPKTVQALLGHSSIQLTLDIYTHVSEQKKRADIQKIMERLVL